VILSAGLSPAWQQILRFKSLRLGEVNRAEEAVWCASGKVINVGVAGVSLGSDVTIVSAIGGISGDIIQRELEYLNVRTEWIFSSSATRVCTTLIDASGVTTELVENTPDVDEATVEDFIDRTRVYANVADVTVLTGSLPANAPADVFARVLRGLHEKVILDLRGDVLNHCLPMHPFLVKPNREELAATLKRPLTSDEELISAMRQLNDWGARWVVVSDGPRGVWVTSDEISAHLIPPKVEVVNPIGCGDSLAAGIARGLEQNLDVVESIRLGMGAAANNAEQLLPARLSAERSQTLAKLVDVREWT
jgi:Fructose-1-phosphate kinase and related fructose-6-phosphate kinase (PfkB)